MNKKNAVLLTAFAFLIFCILPIIIFYSRFESLSDHLEKKLGYKGAAANAVKHAYAASEVYSFFRTILNEDSAEKIVLYMGYMNEYAEVLIKFHKPDTTREIMKDLYNNYAGIAAAQWQEKNSSNVNRLVIILKLAENGTLITSRHENPLYKGQDTAMPVLIAQRWFIDKNSAIRLLIENGLLSIK